LSFYQFIIILAIYYEFNHFVPAAWGGLNQKKRLSFLDKRLGEGAIFIETP